MKLMTNVARGIFVIGACLIFSGTTLNAAKPDAKGLEPYKIVDITESTYAIIGNKAAGDTSAPIAPAITAKKKATSAVRGVVYLPIVSLSSYVPIAAQILMMLLAIAFSGLFGAWLMFRELAKRVQVLQDAMPVNANAPYLVDNAAMEMASTLKEASPQVVNQTPVKKRTLFVSQKPALDNDQQNLLKKQFAEQSNRLEYTPPKALSKLTSPRKHSEDTEGTKSGRMPKNFLINEWFPIER